MNDNVKIEDIIEHYSYVQHMVVITVMNVNLSDGYRYNIKKHRSYDHVHYYNQ